MTGWAILGLVGLFAVACSTLLAVLLAVNLLFDGRRQRARELREGDVARLLRPRSGQVEHVVPARDKWSA